MSLPYVREVGAVLVLVSIIGAYAYGNHVGGRMADGASARDALKSIEAADKRADDAERKLAEQLAKKPETGKRVADAVQNNPAPANCVVPDPVVDQLQQGIDSANSATR